jgi:hypothetical protein
LEPLSGRDYRRMIRRCLLSMTNGFFLRGMPHESIARRSVELRCAYSAEFSIVAGFAEGR